MIHTLWRITSRSRQTRPRVQHAENTEDGLVTGFKDWRVKTDRDGFMCTILLFKDCFDNTIYWWLKELGNISPKKTNITHIQIRSNGKDSPHQLQLTQPNVATLVIVSIRSKFNIFWFLSIPKPKFGCLVKTTDDILQVIEKRWITQIT